jgi:hypothetical protein
MVITRPYRVNEARRTYGKVELLFHAFLTLTVESVLGSVLQMETV